MSRFLALDVDANGLYLATGSVSRGRVVLEQLAALQDDVQQLSMASAPDLGAKLKALLKESKLTSLPLYICLGRDRIILKDVNYPAVPLHEEPAIVRFQALKDLTETPDSVQMDYVPTQNSAGGKRHATVVFIRKDLLNAAREIATIAGVKLAGVVPRPFATIAAVRRAFTNGDVPPPDDATANIGVLNLWDRGGEFIVFSGKELLISRSVPQSALASEAALLGEMKRNLAMVSTQIAGGKIDVLYVAEALASGPGWCGRLQSALPIPVASFDPIAGYHAIADVPAALHGHFIGSVGLLAGRSPNEASPINFMAPRAPKAEPSKMRTRLFIGALLAVIVFSGVMLFSFLEVSKAQRESALLTSRKDSLTKENTQLKYDSRRLGQIEDFAGREVPWVDVFYSISAQFPDLKRGKLISFEGTLEKPALPNARGGTAPARTTTAARPGTNSTANKPDLPNWIAKLKLTVSSEDTEFADRIKDALKAPYYEKTTKETGKRDGVNENLKLFTIETYLLRRKPETFTEKLNAKKPIIPKIEPKEEDPDMPFVDPLAPMGPFAPGFSGGINP